MTLEMRLNWLLRPLGPKLGRNAREQCVVRFWIVGALSVALVAAEASSQETLWEKYNGDGEKAYEQGLFVSAEKLFLAALGEAEKFGDLDIRLATTSYNLGLLYHAHTRYQEAEALYQRALAIREKVLGPEHRDVATILYDLASLCHVRGKYGKAETLYQRSLAISENRLGSEVRTVATILNDLAGLYRDTGKYDEAESLYRRSLTIREKKLGTGHPDVAASLNNLPNSTTLWGNTSMRNSSSNAPWLLGKECMGRAIST